MAHLFVVVAVCYQLHSIDFINGAGMSLPPPVAVLFTGFLRSSSITQESCDYTEDLQLTNDETVEPWQLHV